MDYYTRYRYSGKPEDAVDALGKALARVLQRVSKEAALKAAGAEPAAASAAMHASQVALQYADRVRNLSKLISANAPNPEAEQAAMNAIANVANDTAAVSIFLSVAASGTKSTPSEGITWSFDWDFFKDWLPDMAEKVGALGESTGNPLFALGSALLWDVELLTKALTHDPNAKPKVELADGALDPVLERQRQMQEKLDELAQRLLALSDTTTEIKQEVDAIEIKADKLAELLGKTLVGKRWHVNPRVTTTETNEVPEHAVKAELHGIEELLDALYGILTGGAFTPPGGAGVGPGGGAGVGPGGVPGPTPVPWPPNGPFIADDPDPPLVPPIQTPVPRPRLDPRLKKIYVYEQGVMSATAATDERVVNVRTEAFDLSGWIDLTELRPGDVAEVEILVSIAGRGHRLFARTRFDQPGLRTFSEFARGHNYLSAADVKIVIRQVASSDGFATARDIGYQFVVESR